MATLIPSFSTCSQRMTPGERRFAQRLESKLDDDYLLWYNVPIGPNRLYPDFIVLHPQRGLWVLEVKDWKLTTLESITQNSATLHTPHGPKTVQNPLEQARGYALAICTLLEQDPLLVQADGRYQGKLAFPYGYGLVLAHITRKQFESADLEAVLTPNQVICQDEMAESIDTLTFQEQLWNLSHYQFGEPLTPQQIDRVRWHLFPDIRISTQQLTLFDETEVQLPDILRIMDLQQEQLARSLGEGHRIIHGVAGSGKTLILGYRCQHLAQVMTKPILVLCFNVALSAKLRQMIQEHGLHRNVIVRHFHGWCSDQLWDYGIPKPSSNQYQGEAYINELVQRVIRAVDSGLIPRGCYGAVLVDEGHDFQPEWFKLIVQMVDPETNSLLVLYDDAQNIYEKRQQRRFSFKSVGIQAQGRTTILKLNYRNTQDILTLAYEFAKDWLTPSDASDDEPILIQPQSAGRHGLKPTLIQLPSFNAELSYLVQQLQRLHTEGHSWNDIAILYRDKWMGEKICDRLQNANIPVEWINQGSQSRHYHPNAPSLKLLTLHSSKGLEFPIVFIPGVGYLPNRHCPIAEEARLLYVGMTRAVDQLVITGDRPSEFVKRLQSISQ